MSLSAPCTTLSRIAGIDRTRTFQIGLMCGAFGSIAIRPWLEIRLENRLQYELERALHHSVTYSGDRQDANFSDRPHVRCVWVDSHTTLVGTPPRKPAPI